MTSKRKPYCTDATWVGRSNCKSCSIRHSVLFADLSESELDGLLEPIDNFLYDRGGQIYDPAESPDFVYTIRRGLVKLEQMNEAGTGRIVRLLSMGDILGLEVLVGESYQHTATAVRRVDICRIPVRVIEALKRTHPDLNDQLARRWEDNLETADYWISRLSTGTARQRAAWLIRYLIRTTASTYDCVELLSAADMAAAIGTTVETLSRTMADLKESGILEATGARHYRCDVTALKALSEPE